MLLDHHWEIYDPILSCSNQEHIPTFCSTQPNVYFQKFKFWESGLPLCIVPRVFHFPELIEWCVAHYAIETRSIITQFYSQFFITITLEEITKMLGLNSTNFLESNTIPLSRETSVQKFTSLSSQEQFSFVHRLQKPKHLLQVLNFPLIAKLFQTPIQLILSMYT